MIESQRQINEKTTTEYRFYLSNLALEPKDFNEFIRKYWSIENKLHWQLDVTFLEDVQKTKTGNAPENLAITRKIALQILNKVQDKESMKNRRKMAGWSDQYLLSVLSNF